jgi:hypothetical protein
MTDTVAGANYEELQGALVSLPEHPLISRSDLERDTAKNLVDFALIDAYQVKNRPKAYPVVRELISGYSVETLHRLNKVARSPYIHSIFVIISNDATEDEINDAYMLSPLAYELKISANLVHQYINALAHYENLTPQKNGHYPDRRLAQARALMRVTHRLYLRNVRVLDVAERPEDCIFHIKDDKLSAFIIASDNPESIADLMDERDFTTGVEVANFLATANDIPVSLQTGAL